MNGSQRRARGSDDHGASEEDSGDIGDTRKKSAAGGGEGSGEGDGGDGGGRDGGRRARDRHRADLHMHGDAARDGAVVDDNGETSAYGSGGGHVATNGEAGEESGDEHREGAGKPTSASRPRRGGAPRSYDEVERRPRKEKQAADDGTRKQAEAKGKKRGPTADRQIQVSEVTVWRIVGGRYIQNDGNYRKDGPTRGTTYDDGG